LEDSEYLWNSFVEAGADINCKGSGDSVSIKFIGDNYHYFINFFFKIRLYFMKLVREKILELLIG